MSAFVGAGSAWVRRGVALLLPPAALIASVPPDDELKTAILALLLGATLSGPASQLRQLAGLIDEGVWVVDATGTTVYANPRMERLLGALPAALRPDATLTIVPDGRGEGIEQRLTAARNGAVVTFRATIHRPDGRRRHIDVTASPIQQRPHAPMDVLLICREVTERRRSSAALERLADAGIALTGSRDGRSALSETARSAVEHFADICVVHVIESDSRIGVAAVAARDPEIAATVERRLVGREVDREAGAAIAQVVRTRRAELYRGRSMALDWGAGRSEAGEIAAMPEVRSAIVAPMIVRDRGLGALSFLALASGRDYGEGDLRVAEELAHRAGLVLENAQAHEMANREIEIRQRTVGQMTRLFDLAAALSRALSTAEIVDAVLAEGVPAVGANGGGVSLLSEDGTEFLIAGAVGMPAALVERWARYPRTGSFPLSKAADSGEAVFIETVDDWRALFPESLGDFIASGYQSMASLPLLFEGRLLGGISFDFLQTHHFAEEEKTFMRAVAHQTALALERARLFELERDARKLAGMAEARYRGLFEGSADAVFVLDDSWRIVDANSTATALLGSTLLELFGRSFGELAGIDLNGFERNQRASDGPAIWEIEHELIRADGNRVPVETRAVAIDAPTERMILASSREITRRRNIERAQQALVASVSHDLKSPLAAISLQAQLVLRQARRQGDPNLQELAPRLDVILASTRRMSAIIDELVEVARLRLGHPLQLSFTQVDLIDLAGQAIERHREAAPGHRFVLVAPPAPVTGRWDAGRLERVFDNLLSNAIKYSPNGGEVAVEIACQRDEHHEAWAIVSIRDQGIGIPAADLPYIFEHFRRGANVEDRMVGSGIGLAGVRQIVEQHGGTVSAESIEGAGSTVSLRLPLGRNHPAKPTPGNLAGPSSSATLLAQGVHEAVTRGDLSG